MPIRPENRKRYPPNWLEIRAQVLQRAGDRCEFCGVENLSINPRTGARVILTVMHLNHKPEDCRLENLKAACQQCHNGYDAEHRQKTRRTTRIGRDPDQLDLGIAT